MKKAKKIWVGWTGEGFPLREIFCAEELDKRRKAINFFSIVSTAPDPKFGYTRKLKITVEEV